MDNEDLHENFDHDGGIPDAGQQEGDSQDSSPGTTLEAINEALGPVEDSGQQEAESGTASDQEAQGKEDVSQAEDPFAIPEGLSHKAQERFRNLASAVKEREQQLNDVSSQVEGFRELIKSTGTTAEEFSQAIDYMRMVKEGNLEGALQTLDAQRRMISLAIGKPLPGADPLSQFPDLQQRVAAYQMDEQTAIEMARYRVLEANAQAAHQQHAQQQQTNIQQMLVREQAVSQITQLEKHWENTDPDFSMKSDILMKRLPEIRDNFPPHMWAPQIKMLYESLSDVRVPPRAKQTGSSPLRSSGHSGGAQEPKSTYDAVSAALGY